MGPGSAQQRCTLQRVRDTRAVPPSQFDPAQRAPAPLCL